MGTSYPTGVTNFVCFYEIVFVQGAHRLSIFLSFHPSPRHDSLLHTILA